MSDDCEHITLHFQSGDFYLSCNGCGRTWAMVNGDRNAIDPTRANRGKGSQLSGQLRAADRRKSLIVGNLPEETVAALMDATMSDGIVRRLRDQGRDAFARQYSLGIFKLCDEAADEIERLSAEAKSYRNALEWMRARDDRNGSLPEAYREKIDEAVGGLMP